MSNIKDLLERYRDYPLEVTIETTGRCNARCTFCPHRELGRKNLAMSDELFRLIIDQLKAIPQTHYFYISPFKVNEFLMDKQIFARINYINQCLPNAYIRLFSNFNLATDEDIKEICRIRNLSDIDISLNSLDNKEYALLMGLDLDKTKRNIFAFLDYIAKNGIRMHNQKIILSRVAQSPDTDRQYLQTFATLFEDYAGLVAPRIVARQEWIDFMPSERPLNQDQPCARWSDINICCNGVVAFCCMDGRGAFPWGNIAEKSALEIYNQPAYRYLRIECPNKSQVTPCLYCSQ